MAKSRRVSSLQRRGEYRRILCYNRRKTKGGGASVMKKQRFTYGVVHIGSVHTSLILVSFAALDDVEVIEHVRKETGFGEEVFKHGRLSFSSIRELCGILAGFRRLLGDYGVETVFAVGTSVLREAENRLGILDQIRIRTGFSVEVADMTQEIYYKFFALSHALLENAQNFGEKPVLLMDITSSGLGLTGWQAGRLLFQQNVASGSLSILEHFSEKERDSLTFPSAVRDYIHATLSPLWPSIEHHAIRCLVLSGLEARTVAAHLAPKSAGAYAFVRGEDFLRFLDAFAPLTPQKLMTRFAVTESRANLLLPTLLLYGEVVRATRVKGIFLMGTTFLASYSAYRGAQMARLSCLVEQEERIVQLARTTAAKYGSTADHCARVEQAAEKLFRALDGAHGLSPRALLLLRLGAILHETGKFINLRHYNRHSYQIILGTDFFGVSDAEKEIVANIAYYYSRPNPGSKDGHYARLSHEQQITMLKLCAILRLADALDQGHSGKIAHLSMKLLKEELIVRFTAEEDISLIRWTFARAAALFREIFGIEPMLCKA